MACYVCRGSEGLEFRATETMFHLGGSFTYWECAGCGCVSLTNPPTDWSTYYPSGYYSFASISAVALSTKVADRLRLASLTGPLMSRVRPDATIRSLAPLKSSDRILDVGCGSGQIVNRLRALGYNAIGIDPFAAQDSELVRKCHLRELQGTYDVILLSHSLEHMPDQRETLCLLRKLVSPTGKIVIRIPLALDDWKAKRSEWRELDAPRHLFLHTPESLRLLATESQLQIEQVIFDSDDRTKNRAGTAERGSFVLVRA